ncbi:hypothetical protein [Marinisporobacter balticus]|uniref:Uncharacterized protein n=1 Tax=Marinisporobacter balticus TaxID=2018667 RepID=A0A4R2KRI7_9FIRM|nr:hypothetical protein [Marinisporobacter balticus]TCO76901.1 hypothetical protein EV214_10758 [Marinisporobacter balticus]
MENLKIAYKCSTCEKDCKQFILSGDVKYCPKYIQYKFNREKTVYKPKNASA